MDLKTSEIKSKTPPSNSSPSTTIDSTGQILPASPALALVTIEPSRSAIGFDLRELWAYRELLYFLTWRGIKVR